MKFSIFSINMWFLPFFLSRDNRKRVKRLIEFINKEKPDFVALQETWLSSELLFLKKKLPEYYFTYENGFLFNRAGLLVLSKEKPIAYTFHIFQRKTFLHKVIRRGIQIVRFKNISLCNAHLHTIPGVQDINIALEEFEFLKSKIKDEKNCFLCGDLNIDKKEFEEVNNKFFRYAEDIKNTFSEDNTYVHKWWDPSIVTNKKIDYILAKNPIKLAFKSKIIKGKLSDHYGIYTEIRI